ncbi:MAG: DNA primase [Candidatus Omnitrophica bacterium]|nr:DNA primase [Candidatus Omnitrophota bacterium]
MIPNEIIDKLLDSTDIVEVISSRVKLKKTGRNFKGNCPFHNEKTPSFVVSPDKQIFHCFGCGEGGNAISFLTKYEKLSFMEAVEMLAEIADIKIPALKGSSGKNNELFDKFYAINKAAKDFYCAYLNTDRGSLTMKYLQDRGVSKETIETFCLGYAPNMWDGLINFFKEKKVQESLLETVGLVLPRKEEKGFYDRFRNRLVFPIFDGNDRVIGFGARALNDTTPKYINSPETPIYTKGNHVYGFNLTKKFIKEKGYAVIVEGYMDLIMPYQYGLRNFVATLGTALTYDQIKLLKRHTNTAVVVYDSDSAGEEASLRGMDLLIEMDMNVRIAPLPKGYDPDTFVKEFGKEAFEDILQRSKDLFDYKIDMLMKRYNKDSVKGKTAIATLMLPTLARIKNEILKSSYLNKLAQIMEVDIDAIKKELAKIKTDYSHKVELKQDDLVNKPKRQTRKAELLILSMLLYDVDLLTFLEKEIDLDDLQDQDIRHVIDSIKDMYNRKIKIEPAKMIMYFENERQKAVISAAVGFFETIVDREKTFSDCIKDINRYKLEQDKKKVKEQMQKAHVNNDTEKSKELMIAYNELLKKSKG